jgi:hypothetical protein
MAPSGAIFFYGPVRVASGAYPLHSGGAELHQAASRLKETWS